MEQYDYNATEAVQLLELSPEQAADLTYSELMTALRDHFEHDDAQLDFTSDQIEPIWNLLTTSQARLNFLNYLSRKGFHSNNSELWQHYEKSLNDQITQDLRSAALSKDEKVDLMKWTMRQLKMKKNESAFNYYFREIVFKADPLLQSQQFENINFRFTRHLKANSVQR